MKKLLFLLCFLCTITSFSQSYKFNISGKILSDKDKNPIETATVHLEKAKDSAIVTYTITDELGSFNLEGKSFQKDVKLFVSFIGMESYQKKIDLGKNNNINLKNIYLKEESNLLNEVVVKSRAPITIKKDTLEFNVKSFKTKKDANVEDLLKKLPGVEVDEQGAITVNGKPVNKILVNGKPFFGNDPTITTKNLSKEIIEKIQITDTKSKSEAFTGEKGDTDNKTINLTIKKENNKGWFGRVSAGAGTDDRYEVATMINRFDNDTRISVLASTNNINSPGFSFGEINKMYGNSGGFWMNSNGSFGINGRNFGGGQGIVTSKIGGLNFSDKFNKNTDASFNYFFSGSDSYNNSKSNRAFTLPDRNYFTNTNSSYNGENENHMVDANVDIEIDSTFLINISPSFTFNKRNDIYSSDEESLNENNEITNSFTSATISKSSVKNFSNDLDITKKIGKKGAFIKATITNSIDQTNSDELNNSLIEFFGTNPSSESRDQSTDTDEDFYRIGSSITYRQPFIAEKLFLDIKYSYDYNQRENKRSTFDFDENTQEYNIFNTDLSSNFVYNDITKTPETNLIYKTKKTRFNIGVGLVNRTLNNQDALRPNLSLERSFNNIKLDAGYRYRFDSKANLYLDYSLNNNAPSINQLQPFTNVNNPSNLVTGNPNLSPSQNHRIYANFNKFNWQKRTGMFFYASVTLYKNQIVSNTTIDDNLVRSTTYNNADGGYNAWAGGSYSKNIKLDSITNLKLRVGTRFNADRNINFFNGAKNIATNNAISPYVHLTLDWNKIINIEPRYSVDFTNTTYNTEGFEDQNFTRHNFRLRTRTNIPKKVEWLNDINYFFNPNVIGFNKSSWFWNSSVSYSLFNDKGTITLKAYDLLNQNNNVQRRATQNFIEDSESTILQQYFMVGFSWKFNSLSRPKIG
ncbi:outer membrane beta-barrel protein [Tenacibaculum geojense]|uniref:Outer membrane beta-barrel protein n=1 Tax=Tenacibaculum geojense TaxID=915352 RepID=A0ABW3JQ83_9FLAO